MTSEETPQPQTEQMPAPGFVGQQLRKSREAAGLSVSQVADSQHLRPSIIQAIESGDYQQIDSELFLKGYVRAYADQVGLDPDRLMKLLDEELEPIRRRREEAIEANPLYDIEKRKRQKKRIARGVMAALLILALVYIGLRVYENRAGTDVLGNGADTAAPAEDAQPADAGTGDAATISDSADTAAPMVSSEPGMASPEPESTGDATVAAMDQPVQPEQPVTADQPVGSAAMTEAGPASGDQPVTPSYDDTQLGGAVSEPAPLDDGVVRLKVSFSDKCWVQVTDGRGRTILASLETAADQVDITGAPPLKVIFGATSAVSDVEFEGQPVDMSSFRVVNNRAEFTLGQ